MEARELSLVWAAQRNPLDGTSQSSSAECTKSEQPERTQSKEINLWFCLFSSLKESKNKTLSVFLFQPFVCISVLVHPNPHTFFSNTSGNVFIFYPFFFQTLAPCSLHFHPQWRSYPSPTPRPPTPLCSLLPSLCLALIFGRLIYFGLIKHVWEPLLAHTGFDVLHRAAGPELASPTLSPLFSPSLSLSLTFILKAIKHAVVLICFSVIQLPASPIWPQTTNGSDELLRLDWWS